MSEPGRKPTRTEIAEAMMRRCPACGVGPGVACQSLPPTAQRPMRTLHGERLGLGVCISHPLGEIWWQDREVG